MKQPLSTEGLWRESSSRLAAWFARETGSVADADDLVQETFVRVHERLATMNDAASIRAWIGTIAHHVLADHHRRRRPLPEANADDEAAPADPDPIDRTVAGWLEGFLAGLAPDDAEALRFVDLEGHTQAELAKRHGITLSAAKSRVQRARTRLRARLEACCAFAFDARGGILSVRKRSRHGCGGAGCE